MNLSEHFTLDEFTRSISHPNISNIPTASQVAAMDDLCAAVLEPVRKHFGKPVVILSGFRSPELNKAIGGASASQHMNGEAADIEVYGVSNAALWNFIFHTGRFDQLVAEYFSKDDPRAGWVHVSYRQGKNRKEALSCVAKGDYRKGLVFKEDK